MKKLIWLDITGFNNIFGKRKHLEEFTVKSDTLYNQAIELGLAKAIEPKKQTKKEEDK